VSKERCDTDLVDAAGLTTGEDAEASSAGMGKGGTAGAFGVVARDPRNWRTREATWASVWSMDAEDLIVLLTRVMRREKSWNRF
jgi:hypothetical protein